MTDYREEIEEMVKDWGLEPYRVGMLLGLVKVLISKAQEEERKHWEKFIEDTNKKAGNQAYRIGIVEIKPRKREKETTGK